ncbi:MAG: SDR family oxidoreductase [Armatimonadota bacterium]|nr:MAG: SDR family oxidoreductase [Armatimonadota bacterium]
MSYSQLKNRVALVTGANNPIGIGAATARALAREGVSVFMHYLRLGKPAAERGEPAPTEPGWPMYLEKGTMSADRVLEEIREAGGKAECWEADLGVPENIPALFGRAEQALGPVQILISNHAHCQHDTLVPAGAEAWNRGPEQFFGGASATVTAEGIDRHFAVNTRAVALMMAEFARRHISRSARWGRIVNISTASEGFPGEVSYGASKHALESYSRAAASELGRYGITANIVVPGPTQTGYINAELAKRCVTETPLGRLGGPEDVADVIMLLLSDQAHWITGQLINAGGGYDM